MGLVMQMPSVSQASSRILLFFKKIIYFIIIYIYLVCCWRMSAKRVGPGLDLVWTLSLVHSPAGPGPTILGPGPLRLDLDLDPDFWCPV